MGNGKKTPRIIMLNFNMKVFFNRILCTHWIMIFLLFWGIGCQRSQPKIENTQNQQVQFWQEQFDKHTKRVAVYEDKIVLETDGFFLIESDMMGKAKDFLWSKSVKLFKPDDHSQNEFWIQEIQEEGVVIKYKSQFDHRSFGKNLITIDEGTLKLKWK